MRYFSAFVLCLYSVYGRIPQIDESIKVPQIDESIKPNLITNENEENLLTILLKSKINLNDKTKPCATDLDNNIDADETQPCDENIKEDNGTALLLTPLIEEGRIEEAKNASRVDPLLFFDYESYSGFLTVNSTARSHLFFWYFPVLDKPVEEEPWIIWLQGGPGASSLSGLFDEIGPFSVRYNTTLIRNRYTWLKNHSLVFIDNPVGTGFSFTEDKHGYATNMATYSNHLYIAVKQLIQLFPELRVAPLYIAGESYAGKYVPALGMEIHKHKDAPGGDINLQGLIIGNGYVEPKMISQVLKPFYHFGLLDREQIDLVKPLVESFQKDIDDNNSVEAKRKWGLIAAVLMRLSHQRHGYNFLQDELLAGDYPPYLDQGFVKRALHVGDIKYSFVNITVNMALAPDFLSSTKPLFEELLDHYRVLTYCGQLDQMVPCAITGDTYRTWKWKNSQEFANAPRTAFIHNRRVAGYQKTGGGLTWVIVRGAGHMVPVNKPAAAQEMVTLWTHSLPLPRPVDHLPPMFIIEWVQNNTMVYL